jgi:3-phenylpropionate/trans-cinnamate dioxygenase ferredoxin subunit
MSDWVKVGPVAEIAPGTHKVIDVDGAEVIVANCGGQFYAVEDVCTHDGAPLGEGDMLDCEIICPRHGARFCLRTGKVLSAPAYEPIATFPVRVVDEWLEVRDDRFD